MTSASNLPSYVELRLDKRVYRPGEIVSGEVTVVVSRPKWYESVKVTLEGKTEMEVSARGELRSITGNKSSIMYLQTVMRSPKRFILPVVHATDFIIIWYSSMVTAIELMDGYTDVGLFEAFYSPPEPVIWIKRVSDLARNGNFSTGRNVFAFELALAPTSPRDLVETLKGLTIRTRYAVRVSVNRGMTSRTLTTECELYVQVPHAQLQKAITPPTQFKVSDLLAGEIQSLARLGQPLSGNVALLKGSTVREIISVDLELFRIEDVFWSEDSLRETVGVHTQQIMEGQVPEGVLVPFYFIVPRLVVCPSYACTEYQVSFCMRVNVTVKGQDETESKNVMVTFIR